MLELCPLESRGVSRAITTIERPALQCLEFRDGFDSRGVQVRKDSSLYEAGLAIGACAHPSSSPMGSSEPQSPRCGPTARSHSCRCTVFWEAAVEVTADG
jgi:hypothetical protein